MDLIITAVPSCLWSLRIFPSLPGSRLTIFYRDASSALLQLVNRWLNFTYSRSHAFRYERKNTNPTLVRIELTTSALAGVQITYYRPIGRRGLHTCMYVCMVITYSRVWINRVRRLPILLVVSWTGKMNTSLSPCVPENLVSRDGFSRPVPRQPDHLHTQASKCMDQTCKVAHPARGQLNREN